MSEIAPSAIKIDKIINRIAEGDIKVPAFQRGFVWDQSQIMDLLDSIYNNFPIGSILLWNSMEKLKATRNIGGFLIPDRPDSYPVNYVLDGQQRLSTIYAMFCIDRTMVKDEGQYKVDESAFDIYFDFETEKFLPQESLKEGITYFPMRYLLNQDKLFEFLGEFKERFGSQIKDLHSKFNNYEVPIVTISKRKKTDVGTIFERINNTGTRLTTLDLMIAWTWSEDFHLRDEINQLQEKLDRKGFADIPEKVILQCLSGIVKEATATKDILELTPDDVHSKFSELVESFEKTIDFISSEFKISSVDFLPHSQQLIALTYFFSKTNSPTAIQVNNIKKWFWRTAFSKRYSAQTDDKINADIIFFKELLTGNNKGIDKYSHSLDKVLLQKQKMVKSNPTVRAFLLLLAQRGPLNLVNGSAVDLSTALSKFNRKEYHHIFPKAFLKGKSNNEKIDSVCNFAILPAAQNKVISDKDPSNYIFNILPQHQYREILESNLMPLKQDIYKKNDYNAFLEERAGLIIQFLEQTAV